MSYETSQQALERIESGFSQNDIVSVYYFADCGVAPADITPRQNVLTFKAWKAKGRQVAKGAKGLPLIVWVPRKNKDGDKDGCFRKVTRVFHISQTIAGGSEKGTPCEAQDNPYLVDVNKEHDAARAVKLDAAQGQAAAAKELAEQETAGEEPQETPQVAPAIEEQPDPEMTLPTETPKQINTMDLISDEPEAVGRVKSFEAGMEGRELVGAVEETHTYNAQEGCLF